MNNFVLLLATIVVSMAYAQKPFYAQHGTKPELAYRFRSRTSTEDTLLNNRVGGVDNDVSTTTIVLPIDARGDAELVKRISSWPREKQPFWFINYQQIEAHRNNPQPQNAQTSSRGSFQ